jgi:septal ring factor EnvC (AmiA/AmiB activator)
MEPSGELATQKDLEHLEEVIDGRLVPIEKAIESLIEVVKQVADQRSQIAVLQTKQAATDDSLADMKNEIKDVREDQKSITMKLVKISAWITAGVGLAAIVIPPVLEKVL